jgi:hypothetical protein
MQTLQNALMDAMNHGFGAVADWMTSEMKEISRAQIVSLSAAQSLTGF